MMTLATKDITRLLADWNNGDPQALERLLPLVYDELRRLAASYLRRERPGHTLQPTALVHEAYLRLVTDRVARWQGRAHFFGIAARLMRRVLVEHARAHHAAKRGGGAKRVTLAEAVAPQAAPGVDLLALDDALNRLEELDPQKGRLVELRFFSGLTIEEAAEALAVSPATVIRDWRLAKAWLRREIRK